MIRFYPAAPRLIDLIILSWLVQMLFLHKFLFKNTHTHTHTLSLKRKTNLSLSQVVCLYDRHLLVVRSVPWSLVRKKKIQDFQICSSLISLNAVCACLPEWMKRNSNLAPSKSLLLWGFFGYEGGRQRDPFLEGTDYLGGLVSLMLMMRYNFKTLHSYSYMVHTYIITIFEKHCYRTFELGSSINP